MFVILLSRVETIQAFGELAGAATSRMLGTWTLCSPPQFLKYFYFFSFLFFSNLIERNGEMAFIIHHFIIKALI